MSDVNIRFIKKEGCTEPIIAVQLGAGIAGRNACPCWMPGPLLEITASSQPDQCLIPANAQLYQAQSSNIMLSSSSFSVCPKEALVKYGLQLDVPSSALREIIESRSDS